MLYNIYIYMYTYQNLGSINFIVLKLCAFLQHCLAWPSGEGHGLAFMWREFNPSPTRSCITEAFSLQIKAVSITADGARIYPYPFKKTVPHFKSQWSQKWLVRRSTIIQYTCHKNNGTGDIHTCEVEGRDLAEK